jgi:hypothetical protein
VAELFLIDVSASALPASESGIGVSKHRGTSKEDKEEDTFDWEEDHGKVMLVKW